VLAAVLLAFAPAAAAWELPRPVAQAMAVFDQPHERCAKACPISPVGLLFIKQFETAQPWPYDDATGLPIRDWSKVRGKPTIGFGHLILPHEREMLKGPLSPAQMDALLEKDLATHIRAVDRAIAVPLWPLQTDTLISFDFNSGGLWGSTLRQRVNAGRHADVPYELSRWVYEEKSGAPVVWSAAVSVKPSCTVGRLLNPPWLTGFNWSDNTRGKPHTCSCCPFRGRVVDQHACLIEPERCCVHCCINATDKSSDIWNECLWPDGCLAVDIGHPGSSVMHHHSLRWPTEGTDHFLNCCLSLLKRLYLSFIYFDP
jgi:lysozyme